MGKHALQQRSHLSSRYGITIIDMKKSVATPKTKTVPMFRCIVPAPQARRANAISQIETLVEEMRDVTLRKTYRK